jgi:hypothetical protein
MWKYLRKIKESQTTVLYIENSIFQSVIDVSSAGMLDYEISRYSPSLKSTVGFSGPAVIIMQQSHGVDMCRNGIPRWMGIENVQSVISGNIKGGKTTTSAINYIITQRTAITTELINGEKNYTSKFLRVEFPTKEVSQETVHTNIHSPCINSLLSLYLLRHYRKQLRDLQLYSPLLGTLRGGALLHFSF